MTSWQEDVAGYGQGENLTLKFEKTYTVKYLALKLGSWKDDAAYEQNNRPKELDIQTDHFIRKVTFSDEKKEYWVTFSDTCKTSELSPALLAKKSGRSSTSGSTSRRSTQAK